MDTVPRFLILEEAVCISYRSNTLRKAKNPKIFSPVMNKLYFGMANDLEEGNQWIQTNKPRLKMPFCR